MSTQFSSVFKRLHRFGIPLSYFLVIFAFYPFHHAFVLDADEGVNLVLGQMVLRGFSLYSEIWNDHPPLFTYLLAALMRFFGQDVNIARVFVLLIASGFLLVVYEYLRTVWGSQHAIAGVLLTVLLPLFPRLSVSVMTGLPAIIFAAFSIIAISHWHKRRRLYWILLAAVWISLSVLTKFFTGFLVPVSFIGLLVGEFGRYKQNREIKQLLIPAFLYAAVFTIVVGITLLVVVKPANITQLIFSHYTSSSVNIYQNNPDYHLAAVLRDASATLLLSVVGAFYALRAKNILAVYPIAWTLISIILLSRYVPVWDHHQLLITVPAAWLAAAGAGETWRTLKASFHNPFRIQVRDIPAVIYLCLFVYISFTRGTALVSELQPNQKILSFGINPASTEAKFIRTIQAFAPETRWMITDTPMYAFYSDLPVPPNLVVFALKRFETDLLTDEQIIRTIKKYKPEQILISRTQLPDVRKYMQEGYKVALKKGPTTLFVLRELLNSTVPPLK